jgi:hypothetical protein
MIKIYYVKIIFQSIRNKLVLLLYEQYVNKNSFIVSKINTEYRLQLLRILRTLQIHTHSSTPSPTSYAIQIFGIAISQDNNPEIIEEASLGLAELRHMVYPTAPSLMLPLSKSPSSSSSSEFSEPSSQLLNLREAITFSKPNDNQLLSNECNALIEQNKRPRLEMDNLETETSIPTADLVENQTIENNVLIHEDK